MASPKSKINPFKLTEEQFKNLKDFKSVLSDLDPSDAAHLAWYEKIRSIAGLPARYRGTIILGRKPSLFKVVRDSEELSISLLHFETCFDAFQRFGSDSMRVKAITELDKLYRAAALSPRISSEEAKILLDDLRGKAELLWKEWEGAESSIKIVSKELAAVLKKEKDIAKYANEGIAINKIEEAIYGMFCRIHSGINISNEEKALLKYLEMVPATDEAAWQKIFEKLNEQSKMKQKIKTYKNLKENEDLYKSSHWRGEDPVRDIFKGEASSIQGLLMELWWWRSRPWNNIKKLLEDKAMLDGRKLFGGTALEPFKFEEPLFQLQSGVGKRLEIFDGAVIAARKADIKSKEMKFVKKLFPGNDLEFYDGFISASIEIKAELKVTAMEQQNKTVQRMLKGRDQFFLTDKTGKKVFIISPRSSQYNMTRIIVAPELGAKRRMEKLFPGINALALPTMLDASQMRDAAFSLLTAIAEMK